MAFRQIRQLVTEADGSLLYEFEDKGYQILFYMPVNDVQSNLINYGFTGPTLVVFPDKKTDFAGLRKLTVETGLETVAARNGVGIVLVNPKKDDWKDEEAGAYEAVADNLGIAQANFRDGLAIMKNDAIPDEVSYAILGSPVRMYVYGFGTGADYLALHYLKKVSGKALMGDLGMADRSVVSATLCNLSVTPDPEENDIHVVSVNNTSEQNRVLKENCAEVLERTDVDLYRDFNDYTGNYRRWTGRILQAYNYVKEGIVDKAESVMLPISEDNETFRRAIRFMRIKEHKVGYVTFYDKNMDVHNEKHPLVLVFHGGGDSAYATASLAEWPEIGQKEGFITVAVEMHMNVSAKEVAALIEHLKQEYAIDEERIYATGFSMGGIKSWDLFEQCPQYFAAIMPMDAVDHVGNNCFGTRTENVNRDFLVPTFYVGGVSSPLVELPFQHERAVERISYLAKVNKVRKPFDLRIEDRDNWEDKYVGVKGDRVEVLHDDLFPQSEYIVNYYDSEDGNCYTCIMAVTNHAHEIRPFTNAYCWNFVKRFKRKADGTVEIEE